MNFLLHYGYGAITLPKSAAGERLKNMTEGEMKVLLVLADDPTLRIAPETKTARISRRTGVAEEDVTAAIASLAEAGLLIPASYAEEEPAEPALVPDIPEKAPAAKPARMPKERFPAYSDAEVAALFSRHADLRPMIDMAARELGKTLSEHETASLVVLYDYYGLSTEYIIELLHYLNLKNKANMRYIESCAVGLVSDGIVSVEALRERFSYLDREESMENTLRHMLGMGERAFTSREKTYVREWTEQQVPQDILAFAYEQTVDHTGKVSLGYMNKVINKCREEKIYDRASAEAADAAFREKQKKTANTEKTRKERGKSRDPRREEHSFDADEFLEAALRRTYENAGLGPEDL